MQINILGSKSYDPYFIVGKFPPNKEYKSNIKTFEEGGCDSQSWYRSSQINSEQVLT